MPVKRLKGKIKWFNTKKGFGFLTDDLSQKEFWFHANGFSEQVDEKFLLQDKVIYFEIGENFKGACAIELSLRA